MGKNRYVFWGLVITTLISVLDANIMQTASPTIVKQLGGMELFVLDFCCLYARKYCNGSTLWEIIGYVWPEKAANDCSKLLFTIG
ncbi:hypothetical protein [Neobacillus sp. 19]|uniref:hypothetical protein n=1 Tax=Neobacillus sp. 19 TaxID=3394458 RepID=UPI003BF73F5C